MCRLHDLVRVICLTFSFGVIYLFSFRKIIGSAYYFNGSYNGARKTNTNCEKDEVKHSVLF